MLKVEVRKELAASGCATKSVKCGRNTNKTRSSLCPCSLNLTHATRCLAEPYCVDRRTILVKHVDTKRNFLSCGVIRIKTESSAVLLQQLKFNNGDADKEAKCWDSHSFVEEGSHSNRGQWGGLESRQTDHNCGIEQRAWKGGFNQTARSNLLQSEVF